MYQNWKGDNYIESNREEINIAIGIWETLKNKEQIFFYIFGAPITFSLTVVLWVSGWG